MRTKPLQIIIFHTNAQLKELTGLNDKELKETFNLDDYWKVGIMVKGEIKNKNQAELLLLETIVLSRFLFKRIKYKNNFYYIGNDELRRKKDEIGKE